MMTRHQKFETTELPIAAAVMTVTERVPAILRKPDCSLVSFEFPDDELTRKIVLSFVSGNLCLSVKRYEQARSWLYRRAREVQR